MSRRDIRTVPSAKAPVAGGFLHGELPAVSGRRAPAFTLVELLVVVAMIALLVTVLLPAIGQAVAFARRGTCATNIQAILKSCNVYALEAPLHRGSGKPQSLPYADFNEVQWFGPDGNKSCLWLLIEQRIATPEQFICPALRKYTPAKPSVDPRFVNGTFGYAFQSQIQLRLTMNNVEGNRVLVGDRNPLFEQFSNTFASAKDQRRNNVHTDPSGDPAGQNVGRADQSVKFITDPKVATGGNKEDWIYQSSVPGSDAEGMSRADPSGQDRWPAIEDVFLIN